MSHFNFVFLVQKRKKYKSENSCKSNSDHLQDTMSRTLQFPQSIPQQGHGQRQWGKWQQKQQQGLGEESQRQRGQGRGRREQWQQKTTTRSMRNGAKMMRTRTRTMGTTAMRTGTMAGKSGNKKMMRKRMT
jgi:hypothetical protein